jgi:DNA-binding LacI/PurR family transcriptional regulator
MPITIRDIARHAGVTIGTVSRALKNQPGIADATRQRIRGVAESLGYNFDKLRSTRVRRVVFLLHRQHNTLAGSPFFSPVLHGVEEACREASIAPSFLSVGPADPVREQLRRHHPDALILAGFFEPEVLAVLRETGKPIALIDLWASDLPSVNPDNVHGGFLATRHLLESGRRRIAFLSGSQAHYSIRHRALGYRKALYEAKVLADPNLEVVLAPGVEFEQAVNAAMRQLLALPEPPDAVFAYNDGAALIAMRACQDAGLRVPQDVAFVGFDDIAAAEHASPPLSTLRIDKEALGRAGVALLLDPKPEAKERLMPVDLLERASSARGG